MHPCQICSQPTHARTCSACIEYTNAQLTRAITLIPELRVEAAKTTAKAPGGYSTAAEGKPAGINIGALALIDRLTRAIGDLGARVGVGSTDPYAVRESTYKLAWEQDNDPAYELITELAEAINAANRMVDLAPAIVSHGHCPTCGTSIKAPSDRKVQFCTACGEKVDLAAARETRREIILDSLGGQWLNTSEMVAALEMCGYTISDVDVRNWYKRDRLPAGRKSFKRGAWTYLFDDVLDCAERRELKKLSEALDKVA
ncbi:hypothetical protein ACN08Y_10325 [Rothia sp. P5764]|uniref:hypothetical protein n=1 Tax=Rothia sp. P5764 TaxID=3402654 RepID=UPI003AC8594A